ncbi:MAG: DUF3830 family protein [Alphaproteobacteria bacterium]
MTPQILHIEIGAFAFAGRLEWTRAPATCRRFLELLPLASQAIHVRWSGEAVWIPMGDFASRLEFENHTSHPSRGDMLFYPGGFSETEILLAYGSASFASKMGPLAGNHFLTLVEGLERLEAMGRQVLWEGAQRIAVRQPE